MSTTKQEVIRLLTAQSEPLSGERIARKIGVSRNAVWKAIEQLRREGYAIEAATNRGYKLAGAPDRICVPEIERWLKAETIGARMELHPALDSSVYITYVLRPKLLAERAVMITSMAAVAVARAIELVADVAVQIKWVNDLYIAGKKVCGILCEAGMDFESGMLDYAVLGIGVNVAAMRFPPELEPIATSIGNECGCEVSRSRLIAEISNQLEALYGQLDTCAFMAESRARSNVIGRDVLVLRGDERFEARAVDIDDQGRLVIQTPAGLRRVGSGEISLKLR